MIGGDVSGEFAMLGATYDMDIIAMVSKCYEMLSLAVRVTLCA